MGNRLEKPEAPDVHPQPIKTDNDVVDLKILLLGSFESGKSTLFKQIKITETSDGFTHEQISYFQKTIYWNLINTIEDLIDLLKEKGNVDRLLLEHSERVARLRKLTDLDNLNSDFGLNYTEETANDIEELFKDSDIINAFNNMRNETHIFDGALYFFKDLERLRPSEFKMNNSDILNSRQKTVVNSDIRFEFNSKRLKVVDVGGQRSIRKKWISAYDEVDALIFVVSLSDFDQKCYEDDSTNRMQESIDLFSETINDERFRDTPIILLLNKTDVFTQKLQQKSIRTLFGDEYTGLDTFEESVKFIENKYLSTIRSNPNRILLTKYICATQTDEFKKVFNEIKLQLLEAKFPELREAHPSN